jgi:N-acetylglucosaminyldiphosphoundecaprenol N-acetyl-beta-D-mannosaminyltransferase
MTYWLGGVRFNNVTMTEAVDAIVSMALKSEKPCLVCTANLDHLVNMQSDAGFRKLYRDADFVVADGMPLVWLSHIAGAPLKERVAGSDLFWQLGKASETSGIRLFLLGGQPGSAEKAAAKMYRQFPNAQICGTYCPPHGMLDDAGEDERIRAMIAESQPDVLLVGFGSPKQEKWIAEHLEALQVPVSIGVGAAFDMAAGMVRRAPRWLQSIGMEWLFRLAQEPHRLWGRYVGRDLPYLVQLVALTVRVRMRRDGSARDAVQRAEP